MGNHDPQRTQLTVLSEGDARLLDRLIELRTSDSPTTAPLDPADEPRARHLEKLLGLLEASPVEDPPADIVSRTIHGIQEQRQRERFTEQIAMLDGSEGGRFQIGRWLEITAAAAMIIVGISLMFPMMAHSGAEARRIVCSANLATAGSGFGQYANDNRGLLPREGKMKAGDVWIRVGKVGKDGKVQSNSAHLYLLVRHGYLQPNKLVCPENPHVDRTAGPKALDWATPQSVPYSGINQHTDFERHLRELSNVALLADRNPLFTIKKGQLIQDPNVPITSSSHMHQQRGQNVLLGNGAVPWLDQPLVGDDNIWTIQDIDRYSGNESPARRDDAHLVP